jgi:hypothetical protein
VWKCLETASLVAMVPPWFEPPSLANIEVTVFLRSAFIMTG